MPHLKTKQLEEKARIIRKRIIKMLRPHESHHVGCSLSIVDIAAVLYFDFLHINPKKPESQNRDIFILSKGHAGAAVYATLAERGFFKKSFLKEYDKDGGLLPEHITKVAPGIEFSAGSLGHGLPVGVGFAWDSYVKKKGNNVVVLISDGELNEGTTWEALLLAGHHKLNNLIVLLDYNKFQGYGRVEDVMDVEPLAKKVDSFKWNVYETNGHSVSRLRKVFGQIKKSTIKKPHFVIAHTIKGKGVPYYEGKFESHYKSVDEKTKKEILKNL